MNEAQGNYEVAFVSDDGTSLSIEAEETDTWNEESVFEDLSCVSEFFEQGSVGYSPDKEEFEGLELKGEVDLTSWSYMLLDKFGDFRFYLGNVCPFF